MELGTGRSATWPELSGFGANPDETKKTWDEFVRVIPKMWMQERFAWNGRMFSMPERAVLPKPLQKPHPPMWVAVTSPGTEIDAADRGLGCLGLSPGSFADSEKKVTNYRRRIEVCDPVGAFVNDKVLTVNFLSCCEDGDLGRRNGLKVASMFSYMAAQLLSAKEVLPTHSYPSEGLLPALRRESGSPGDAAKSFKGVTMGTPDDVADAITAWENVGFDGINFIHQFMEVVPQQYVLDSMRLFAEEVMPRFKTGARRRATARRRGGRWRRRGWPDAARRLPRHPPAGRRRARGRPRRPGVAGRRRRHPPGPLRGPGGRPRGAGAAGPQPDHPARHQLPRLPGQGQRLRPVRPGPAAADGAVRRPAPGVPDLGPLRQPGAVRGAGGFVGIPDRTRRRSACAASTTGWTARCGDGRRAATILRVSLVDPVPVTGHDVQYPPGMHLARIARDGVLVPRIVQVDSEYEFRRADRGRPELTLFDPAAWGDERLVPDLAVSASFAACDMTIANVRYICNPDIPAAEGTEKVSDK